MEYPTIPKHAIYHAIYCEHRLCQAIRRHKIAYHKYYYDGKDRTIKVMYWQTCQSCTEREPEVNHKMLEVSKVNDWNALVSLVSEAF